MEDLGFIALHRKLVDSDVWRLPGRQPVVWIQLLFAANWHDSRAWIAGEFVTIPRGSVLMSERTFAERIETSRWTVRAALKNFLALGMITREVRPASRPGPSVVTIVNYARYQDVTPDPRPDDRPAPVPVTVPVTVPIQQVSISKSHKQKHSPAKIAGAEPTDEPPRETPLPDGTDWQGLVDAMTAAWAVRYPGRKLAWQGRDFKALRPVVVTLTDTETWRRWEIYLGNSDHFYNGHPVSLFCSQINRFVVAPATPAVYQDGWEGERRSTTWRDDAGRTLAEIMKGET